MCWSRALEVDPLNAYVCHALSNLELRLRNFERAGSLLREVVQQRPTAALCVALAELERQLGRREVARELLLDALRRCRTERSKILLALSWLEEDAFADLPRARKLLDQAIEIDGKNVRVHVAKANMHLRRGETQLARQTLRSATALPAEDGQHYTMWSTLELDAGNVAQARSVLQRGGEGAPRRSVPAAALGRS